jgi:uncharacterized zinc-type alcohol dehydrogenase-like protein
MSTARAYAIDSPTGSFAPTTIVRRDPGPTEVAFDIAYCGICHSDIHNARQEWGPTRYPLVPGHEIAGVVTRVGRQVTKFKIGDRVGVGCFVDSCGQCDACRNDTEQFCHDAIFTYNSIGRDGLPTAGGYSTSITVEQNYVCHIPDSIPLASAAPLLCAGITTYSPLKRWGAGPGKRVAIIGMGGLGHMGVQIAAAMGAEVAVISQTRHKEADGRRFGASEYYALEEPDTLTKLANSFDLMLSTVAAAEDMSPLLRCLKTYGTFVDVGMPASDVTLNMRALCLGNKVMAGSQIGGIAQTQEMLDFCAEHKLAAQVEVIRGDQIDEAYDNVIHSRVRYRYVIDTATFPRM